MPFLQDMYEPYRAIHHLQNAIPGNFIVRTFLLEGEEEMSATAEIWGGKTWLCSAATTA